MVTLELTYVDHNGDTVTEIACADLRSIADAQGLAAILKEKKSITDKVNVRVVNGLGYSMGTATLFMRVTRLLLDDE